MSQYLIQGESLTAIADAIRAKVDSSESMTPEAMAASIADIQIGLTEIMGFPIADVKTGTFTVSSDTRYGPTLTLWPGTYRAVKPCMYLYCKSGFTSGSSSTNALVSSFFLTDIYAKYGDMTGNTNLAKWGTATYGLSSSSVTVYQSYAVIVTSDDSEAGTWIPTINSVDGPVAYFKAGVVYEWVAWRRKYDS